MDNPIIELHRPIELDKKILMRTDGSITQDGMKILDKLWREKKENEKKPPISINYMCLNLESIIDGVLENDKGNGLPTFFLTRDESEHWRAGFLYNLPGEKIRVFVFDSAPLKTFPLCENDEDDSELDEEASENSGEASEVDEELCTLYFRNERLLTESGEEKSHLVTSSGCAMFALKYVHKLIDLLADKTYEETIRFLMPRTATAPEEQKAGVNCVMPMPDELLYLSQPSRVRAMAIDTDAVERRVQRRATDASPDRNNTVRHFVLKAEKKLLLYVGEQLFSQAIQQNNWKIVLAPENQYYLEPFITALLPNLGHGSHFSDHTIHRFTFILGYLIYHDNPLTHDKIKFILDIPGIKDIFYSAKMVYLLLIPNQN